MHSKDFAKLTVSEPLRFELVVIGGGPAGVSGAIAAGILGKRAVLIEKEAMVGGAGINTGTIPSKTLARDRSGAVRWTFAQIVRSRPVAAT